MKQKLFTLVLTLVFFITQGIGQITITNATFPSPGDPWAVAVDSATYLLGITGSSSTSTTWDFNAGVGSGSQLENELEYLNYVQATAQGTVPDSFPSTNLLLPFFEGEGYCVKGATSIEVHGFHGDPLNLIGADITAGFTDPITIYNAPMTYGDVFSDFGEFYVEIDGANIPPGQFPITVDSARIWYEATIVDTVDAFGTLITPSGSYDVLRISRIEYRDTKAEAKVPIFNWVDVAQYAPELGPDTLWTWIYRDAVTSQNILEIDLEWNGSTSIYATKTARWLRPANEVNNQDFKFIEGDLKLYPNPAVNELNIEFSGLQSGDYTIKLYSVLGQELYSETHDLMEDTTVFFDTSDFTRGTYLLSVQNDEGTILSTKRLIINKP